MIWLEDCLPEFKRLRNHLRQCDKLSSELVNSFTKKTISYVQFRTKDSATDYSTQTKIENQKEEEANLLKYHYNNDLLARTDNFLNLDSDESDPD